MLQGASQIKHRTSRCFLPINLRSLRLSEFHHHTFGVGEGLQIFLQIFWPTVAELVMAKAKRRSAWLRILVNTTEGGLSVVLSEPRTVEAVQGTITSRHNDIVLTYWKGV